MKHPASDQEVRREALDATQSFILEAPAGSGKTDLLTARYLCLLARVSHPGQILAVTFTRKAAAQMANRITEVLRLADKKDGQASGNPWEAFLLSLGEKVLARHKDHPSILLNPDSFRVGTFHSFCASIVRSWPLEAKILPGIDILEDLDQEAMLDGVVDQYVRDVVSGKTSQEERAAYERRLVSSNNYPAAVAGQLKELMRRRDRLKDFPDLFSTRSNIESLKSELEQRLQNHAALFLSELRQYFVPLDDDWRSLKKALGKDGTPLGESFPESIPATDFGSLARWKEVATVFLTGSGTPRKQFGAKYGFPKDFGKSPSSGFIRNLPSQVATLLAFVRGWPEPMEDNVGFGDLRDLLILGEGVLNRLQELLRSRGMDYLELELAAQRALEWTERPSESLIFHHDHLRHILVDEAQDLNDAQVEILGKLTEGWESGDGRTVFMVGDPKQSIYRFRRSEVSLFYDLKEKGLKREPEAALPLRPLRLTANFRSRPHLVQFANKLFERVMASPRREHDEVDFSRSEPAVEEPKKTLPIRVAIFYGEPESKEKALPSLEREAQWVAKAVSKLHRDEPKETIAILVPVRTHLDAYVEALGEVDVPLRLMEGMRLEERPEVRHLLNLFTAMVRPYDDLAWAGALRAPWFRVSNQLLLDLASGQGLWSQRILSKRESFPDLAKFCVAFTEANKMFGREPYASTLSRLWEDLDGPRLIALRYGEAGIANARAFFNLLDPCSGLPGEEALARLHRALAKAYTPPDPKGSFSTVSMMTIHKAKGLEFDHVFAVNLDYSPLAGGQGEQPAYRMERLPGKERHFLVAATADRRTGEENLASCLLKDLEKNRTLAEVRRLFYVVSTRARESLTLSGKSQPPDEGTEEAPFKNPLSALLNAMQRGDGFYHLLENPEPPILKEEEEMRGPLSLIPPPFEAQTLPYRIMSPSRVEDETLLAVESGEADEEEDYGRARGLVIHRVLETLARNDPAPDLESVAVALSGEGIPPGEAKGMAPQVLGEANRAWNSPEFRSLRESAQEVHSEMDLEDFDGENTLRVGRFDLLLKTQAGWVVVDYKTGQPEGDVEAWLNRQMQHYRSQLTAYIQMVAKVLDTPEEKIRWAMLFTSLPRLAWQERSQ